MKTSIPGCVTKISTLADKTMRLVIDCQESPPETMTELFSLKGRLGWFFFQEKPIDSIEEKDLPEIKLERHEKHPSTRLRAVLYVLWEQAKIDIPFDPWYREQMEKFISAVKEKLNPL